ncbi:hypothetical protein JCM10450v2_002830 [Rhodotorula kratochvilovae]
MVSLRAAVAPLAILAASSSLVDALPSRVRLSGSIPSINNADGTVNDAALQRNVADTFKKLDVETQVVSPPRRLAKKCTSSPTTVPLHVGAEFYAGDVTVGTPAQHVSLIFDTGSYDMIVQTTTANGGPAFDKTKSSTVKSDGTTVQFNYVTGSFTGVLASDTVSVGGLSVAKQPFGLIEAEDIAGVSGVLGFGLPGNSNIRAANLFDNLLAAGKLPEAKFGLSFSADGATTEAVLGGENKERYTGALQTLENQHPDRWILNLQHLFYGRSYVIPRTSKNAYVILDSASTVVLHKKIPGAVLDEANGFELTLAGENHWVDRWAIPCSAISTIKSFGFQFNRPRPLMTGTIYEYTPENLIYGPIEDGSDMCATTLWGVDIQLDGQTAGILGIPFLRNQYTVFNYGSADSAPSISFGKLA